MEATAPQRRGSSALDYEVLRDELRSALSRTRLGRFAGEASLSDEDVVQEAIARLIAQVEAKEEAPRDPGAWLFRAATNLIKDRIKLDALHPTAAHEPASAVFEVGQADPGIDDLVEAKLSQAEYAHIRDRLDREEAAVVVLHEAGLTVRGAAEVLGKSKSACQDRLKTALDKIAAELDARSGKGAESRVRSLATAIVAGTLSSSERAAAAREMQYNLALRAELSSLRHGLHEVATLIPLEEALARHETGHSLIERGFVLVDRAREAAFSAGHSMHGSESAAGGLLAGTGQKIVALCATGAAAATCVGAGVVGPGVAGVDVVKSGDRSGPQRIVSAPTAPEPTTSTPGAEPTTSTAPTESPQAMTQNPAEPTQTQPTPVQQVNKELYGSGSSTGSGSTAGSRDFAAPVGSSSTGGGGGSTSSGRENFGP